MSDSYDLIVMGSGPAGQRAAVQAAKLGKKALVIEKNAMGGSCLHYGTIPSKTLREAALSCDPTKSTSFREVMDKIKSVVSHEESVIAQQLKRNHVEWVQGVASFESAHHIKILGANGTRVVEGAFIVIATGTRPHRAVDLPVNADLVFDSDTIFEMKKLPRRMVVLGAGVIGCEYASIFSRLGVEVSLLDRRADLLRSVDTEVVGHLVRYYNDHQVQLKLSQEFRKFEVSPSGQEILMETQDGVQSYGALLYCMGRSGNAQTLSLDKAGLAANDRGLITVNPYFQTSQPHIYAVGDVIGSPALAASSSEQGRLAAAHAFAKSQALFPTSFPYGIYTIPEISSVGAHEEELKKNAIPYVIGRAHYKELARGKILGDDYGFLKLLVHSQSREVLGVHVIGSQATELVHIGQTAMRFGAKVDFFVESVFNYPTLAEAYKVAAYNAFNQLLS